MKRRGRKAKINAVPNEEVGPNDPSDTEYEEKHTLDNTVGSKQNEEEQEGIHSSSEDSDENGGEEDDNIDGEENEEAGSEEEEEDEDSSETDEDEEDEAGSDKDSDVEDKKNNDSEEKQKESAKKKEKPRMTYRKAFQIIGQVTPELIPLIKDSRSLLLYLDKKLLPIMKVASKGTMKDVKAVKILTTAKQVIVHYMNCAVMYINSKDLSKPEDKKKSEELMDSFKTFLENLQDILESMDDEINFLMKDKEIREGLIEIGELVLIPKDKEEKIKPGSDAVKKRALEEETTEAKKRCLEKLPNVTIDEKTLDKDEVEMQNVEEDNEDHDDNDEEEEEEEEASEEGEDEKQGLTPKTKKENRNPRVKNKNKYKKANKKRKGPVQVQEPKKEPNKHGGESSGIKKNIPKGTKLK